MPMQPKGVSEGPTPVLLAFSLMIDAMTDDCFGAVWGEAYL